MKAPFTTDLHLFSLIKQEEQRLEHEISLIASENYTSQAVMDATGSVLTNKYAEGYAGKRYYAGCKTIDTIENLAIERCKSLFGSQHVNVQPHAGSQANMAVYHALLTPGDTVLAMSLAEGGHLTHGHAVNFSGSLYNFIHYTVNRTTEQLDYAAIEQLAQKHRPKLIIAGASAYSRTIDFKHFSKIAQSIGAYFMADIAHIAGLVVTGLHPNPVPYADIVTSTTHKTLRGPRGGLIMCTQKLAQKIDKAVMPGTQGGPLMHAIAAKAVAFYEAQQPEFVTYQKEVIANAQALAHTLTTLGYRIVAGGTDNHLFIIDLSNKKITGLKAEQILEKVGIIVSRSCIPFDTQKPWITSGIRIGTPAMTTRGMGLQQAQELAQFINQALQHRNNDTVLAALKTKVRNLCITYPVYSTNKNTIYEKQTS